jgi:hypothetical protein
MAITALEPTILTAGGVEVTLPRDEFVEFGPVHPQVPRSRDKAAVPADDPRQGAVRLHDDRAAG